MENSNEIRIAREIINKGLEKAAESLSFFMKEKISISEINSSFNQFANQSEFSSKKGENIHLLITEVIGELKGICCLIFSETEANRLRTAALPPEIISNPQIMAEMKDGIMLEVDNIISASVITQFSNILKHKIYGGVPALKVVNSDELNAFIQSRLREQLFIISFNTHFKSAQLDFSPQFLWLFDKSFSDSISAYTSSLLSNS